VTLQAGRESVAQAGAIPAGDTERGRRRVAELVAIGFCSGSFVAGQGNVTAFPSQPSRDDFGALIDAVESGLDGCGNVIAIIPAWDSEPALRRLETVKAAIDANSLAVYATELPPLAGAVLTSLAGAVAGHAESAGMLYAGLEALERELIIYTWMGSVAGLSKPSPSLAQHAISLWPPTAFGVSLQPEPLIKRLTPKDRSMPFPTSYRPMSLAVSAHGSGDGEWVREVVAPGLGNPPVKEVGPAPGSSRWWGTSRLVEAVAYPIDVPVVSRRMVQGLSRSLCKWCGELIGTARCPFCALERSFGRTDGGAS
jgi:hypothetical protein